LISKLDLSQISFDLPIPSLTITDLRSAPIYETAVKIPVPESSTAFKFIKNTLGINEIVLKAGLNTAPKGGGPYVVASLDANKNLVDIAGFTIDFVGGDFVASIDEELKGTISITPKLLLKNYDPIQNNEPDLRLSGLLTFQKDSFTGGFKLEALKSNDPAVWKNPFGLPNSELKSVSLELKKDLKSSSIGEVLLAGDFRYQNFDITLSGLVIDIAKGVPKAIILTVNKPVNLFDIWAMQYFRFSPAYHVIQNLEPVQDAMDFLRDIIDVNIVSIDSDKDGKLDPLLKVMPESTTIGGTTLQPGFAINGEVEIWDKKATLVLESNPFNFHPNFKGALTLPAIDLKFLKLQGYSNDIDRDANTLNLNFNIQPDYVSMAASVQLEMLGKTMAGVNMIVDGTNIKLQDLTLGFEDILSLRNINLEVDLSKPTVEGSGQLWLFGTNIATGEIDLDSNGLKVSGNLNFFNILSIDNASIDIKSLTNIEITGKAKLFGLNIAEANISLKNGKLNIKGDMGYNLPVVGNIGATLEITLGSNLNDSSVSLSVNVGILGHVKYTLRLADIKSIGDVFERAAEEALGSVMGLLNDAIDGIVQGFNSLTSGVMDYFNKVGESLENGFRQSLGFLSGTYNGNDSNNEIYGDWNANKMYGHRGNDKLVGQGGNDSIWGGPDGDQLWGMNDTDYLYGESGDDELHGNSGNDHLYGGDNTDVLYGEEQWDKLHGDSGNDKLHGGPGNDSLYGGIDQDYLYGDDDDDDLRGERGYDFLSGGNGNDTLYGGLDEDRLYGDTGNDLLNGEEGKDELHGGHGEDTLRGGNDTDILYGQQGHDFLQGGDGDDLLYGEDNGKQGQSYSGSWDNDTLDGEGGNDYLFGGVGNDSLKGGSGDDVLYGDAGNDTLHGDEGNDLLNGHSGNDQLNGGIGNDTLYGQDGNDLLNGEQNNDILYGGEGNDSLLGGELNDLLKGEEGDDLLDPGSGNDTIDGGAGNDTLRLTGKKEDYKFNQTETGWRIVANNGNVKIVTGVENFTYQPTSTVNNNSQFTRSSSVETESLLSSERKFFRPIRIIDGYISTGKVFFDGNLNGILDEGESFTITQTNGDFNLNVEIEKFDKNQNGEIEYTEGQFVLMGGIDVLSGVDVATGLAMATPLTSTLESTVITPLTTIIAELVKQGNDPATAEAQVKSALGLPAGVDLNSYDPLEAIANGESEGISVFGSMIQVQNTIVQMAKFINGVSETEVAQLAYSGINAISNQTKSGTPVDLTNTETIQSILQDAITQATQSDPNINPTELATSARAASEIMSLGNQIVKELVESGRPIKDIATDITKSQAVSVGQVAVGLPELSAGIVSVEEFLSKNTKEAILERMETVEVNDPTVRPIVEDYLSDDDGSTDDGSINDDDPTDDGSINDDDPTDDDSPTDNNSSNNNPIESPTVPIFNTPVFDNSNSELSESDFINSSSTTIPNLIATTIECIESRISLPNLNQPNIAEIFMEGNTEITEMENGKNKEFIGTIEADSFNAQSGNDNLYGLGGNDILLGQKGDDYVEGGADQDSLRGGKGDDILIGNFGDDTLYGDRGNDSLNGSEDNDLIYGGKDHDFLLGGKGTDTLYGQQGNDTLFGNQNDDFLAGGEGDDTLCGSAGNDILNGDEGDDILDSGSGRDLLNGGVGNDTLYGCEGDNTLTGDLGNDLFIIGFPNSLNVITDFTKNQDKIAVSGAYFTDLNLEQDSVNTLIKLKNNNQQIATLLNVNASSLTSSDFSI
jgi:Ca2+-binding RTX toxin-like protein